MLFTPENWMWRLPDGRYWSTAKACFVDEAEALAWAAGKGLTTVPPSSVDTQGERSLEGLRQALVYYGLPLGELMTLEEARADALTRLNAAFASAEADGKVMSSAGFVIDATRRSNRDIEGLITSMEASSTPETAFCAADNSFHTVTLEQLRAMRLEVITYGQALYARKWELRSAINEAQSVEAVCSISISFTEEDVMKYQ